MNFKMKVAENIGRYSVDVFGVVGDIIEVVDGVFFDKEGFFWNNDGNLFLNVEQVNKFFNVPDVWNTRFELVEE